MKKTWIAGGVAGALAQAFVFGTAIAGGMGAGCCGADYRWNGVSLGGNIGGKWAQFAAPLSIDTLVYNGTTYGPSEIYTDTTQGSFTGGAQLGYDLQINRLVLGIEGNFNAEQLQSTHEISALEIPAGAQFLAGDSYTVTNSWQSSILGRLGMARGSWLVYLTAGIGFADAKFSTNRVAGTSNGFTLPATSYSNTRVLMGGTYGIGTEYAFSDQWRLGVEGRYTDYDRESFYLGTVPIVATSGTTFVSSAVAGNLHMQTEEVLLKLKYLYHC